MAGDDLGLTLAPATGNLRVTPLSAPLAIVRHAAASTVGSRGMIWALPGLVWLALAYLLTWQRGPYYGDYSSRLVGMDPVTGIQAPVFSSARMPTFPARALDWLLGSNLHTLMWSNELLVRLIVVAFVALNALLLGWLVWRILGSSLPAVVAGWLFLVPLEAGWIVLDHDNINMVVAATFALLFLHLCWVAIRSERSVLLWALAGAAIYLVMLSFIEADVTVLALVALPMPILARRSCQKPMKALLGRAIVLTGGAAIASAATFVLLYSNSPLIAQRGGLGIGASELLTRSLADLDRFRWLAVSPDWALPLMAERIRVGLAVATGAKTGMILLVAVVAAIIFAVTRWVPEVKKPARMAARGATLLGLSALVLAGLAVVLPGALTKGFLLDERMLYLPWACASVAIACAAWVVALAIHRTLGYRVLIGSAALLTSVAAVGMTGYAKTLALRSQLDAQQIASFQEVAPSSMLPPNTYVVPVFTERPLPGVSSMGSRGVVGAFEADYSAGSLLRYSYHRQDLRSVTMNRWSGLTVSAGTAGSIVVQGQIFPLQEVLLWTYDGRHAYVIDHLVLVGEHDGLRQIDFPIAAALRRQGVRSIALALPAGRAAFRFAPAAEVMGS